MIFTDIYGCKGTFRVDSGATANGGGISETVYLIEVNNAVYIKPNESTYKLLLLNKGLPLSMLSQVTGKYINATSKSALASLAYLCDAADLASEFEKGVSAFVKDGTGTIDGQATEAIKQHGYSGTLYISESTPPEIV
jgi:hypothetical protein